MKKKLLFAANILAWGMVLAVAILLFLRMQEDAEDRERLRRDLGLQPCMVRLTAIGEALKTYAGKHNGKFPSALEVLIEEKLLEDGYPLECPEKGFRYLYLYDPGSPVPCSPGMPLVIDRISSHSGRINILYADFQVKSEPVTKKKYTRIAIRKSECTKEERRLLRKRLREFDRAFFLKDE